eukprot:783033-Pyramimonas_sp.AAC.1
MHQSNFVVKLLHLPGRRVRDVAMRLFRDARAPCVPRGHAFANRVRLLSSPSPKDILVNSKWWGERLQSHDFPCASSELGLSLGVPLPADCHVCARADNCILKGGVPRHFHYGG